MLPTQSDWTGRGVFATRPALRETNPSNSTPPDPVRGRSEEAGEGKPTLRGRRVHYGKHSTKLAKGWPRGEKNWELLVRLVSWFSRKGDGSRSDSEDRRRNSRVA